MKILIIPGLTLPEVSQQDIERIRTAAGPGGEVRVAEPRAAVEQAGDVEVILGHLTPRQLATAYRLGPDTWIHRPQMRRQEIELTGCVLGCIGFGGTGRAMARRAAAFGMRCQALDSEAVPGSDEVARVQGTDWLPELLTSSDVVAVCCPPSEATRNLLDDAAFARMKPSAFLVNVTRGEVMNEQALVSALRATPAPLLRSDK
ncbi:MAG: NAD(P)-dependent oxidoreductase [Pseudomonadales bacterium]